MMSLKEKTRPEMISYPEVGSRWEEEAQRAGSKGARVVPARFGIVLDKSGVAMPMMCCLLWQADHRQRPAMVPLDSYADLVAAFQFVIDQADIKGPVNFCAPTPFATRT